MNRKKEIAGGPFTEQDKAFMAAALDAAWRVRGRTLPNPPVGAVIVRKGRLLSRGGTAPAGGPHAEIQALRKAGQKALGSELYVTLEPCCHFGRTPPCTKAIIAAGISRVFIGSRDPNPRVTGKGCDQLKKAGIPVCTGLLKQETEDFYKNYAFFVKNRRPKIILKTAQSLDGSINARKGMRTTISGKEACKWAHYLRSHVDAVLIGANTLRIDNPRLVPRAVKTPRTVPPDAIILTKSGNLPQSLYLLQPGHKNKCVIISPKILKLPDWVVLEKVKPSKNFSSVLEILKKRGYHAILVEGGPTVISQWLVSGFWDQFFVLTAPIFLPHGVKWLQEQPVNWQRTVNFGKFSPVGKDMLLEILPRKRSKS